MLYKSEKELIYKSRQAEGKTFGEIDKSGRIENEKAKGQLGQIIEESFFGYEVNSKKEPDFAELGIELKVTPVRRNKNGTLSAKERLVLNIINYHEEVQTQFENSSVWTKNKEILMMFYEWIPKVRRAEYQILKSYLHKFPEDDLAIIKQDWEFIVQKIKDGLAHELSEADTNYLAASTKGANRSSLRTQPFNEEMAMQRAFSLKQSYMTALVRKVIRHEDLTKFTTSNIYRKKTLEQSLNEKFIPYIGKTLEEVSSEVGISINTVSKSFLPLFVSGLLGIKGTKLNQIEEFAKANIKAKTVRLETNGLPEQHMSFENVDFIEWGNESWDDSWLKNHFEETKFLLVVFEYKETKKQNPHRTLFFKGIKLWNMPIKEIDGRLHDFWIKGKTLINKGVKLEPVQQKNRVIIKNNLPKPKSNGLCHLRPKGRGGSDKTPLPDGQLIAKQSFWLDKKLIGELCSTI